MRRWISVAWLLAVAAGCGAKSGDHALPPEKVADMIHLVIQADRTTYARQVVDRLQNEEAVIKASEHFREDKTLPLPSQMMRMGAQLVAEQGGFRYALISEWAINKANMPRSDFEKKGLAALQKTPDQPYRDYVEMGGKRYFAALYADKAVSKACVLCHNGHQESPRHDFKLGDVMGGISVTIPLQ